MLMGEQTVKTFLESNVLILSEVMMCVHILPQSSNF